MSQQRTYLSSLPLELFQIITTFIDDLDTLVAWNRTCYKSRQASSGQMGEHKFQELFRKDVPYWNAALIAARVQLLDLQDGWTRETGKPWVFQGVEVNKDWFRDILTWPAKRVYDIFLGHLGNELFVPWIFEYCVLQANQKFAISFLASREQDQVLRANPPFDQTWDGYMAEADVFLAAWFPAFYWALTLLFADEIFGNSPGPTEGNWWDHREHDQGYVRTKASWSSLIAYMCSTATETEHQAKKDEELLYLGRMWTSFEILNDRATTYIRSISKSAELSWSTYEGRRKAQLNALLNQTHCPRENFFFFDVPFSAKRAPLHGKVFTDLDNLAELVLQRGEKGHGSLVITAVAPQKNWIRTAYGRWISLVEHYLADVYRLELAETMTTGWAEFPYDGGFLGHSESELFFVSLDDHGEDEL